MRIAYVVSLFPKLSETFILREIVELRRRGHEITIVSLKRRREAVAHAEAEALRPATFYPRYGTAAAAAAAYWAARRPLRLLRVVATVALSHASRPTLLPKGLGLLPAALEAAVEVRRRGVQHLHAHWATSPATATWIMSRLTGVPYSVTGHAHDLFLPNPMLALKVRDARFFATISEYNRARLIQALGPEALGRIRLIRCGLPLAGYPFAGARRVGDPPHVVSVGRLVDYKGFDVLIRACARLRDRGRRVRCTIVGEGPERPRLRRLVEDLRLDGDVAMEGERRQPEVARLIASASLFVLASVPGGDGQQDGIPIVLTEAMALGVPVVSTKLSGIPELVVDNGTGLLVAPGDDEHLAAAMERLLADEPLAETLRLEARRMVEREFDVARSVDLLSGEFTRDAAGDGA